MKLEKLTKICQGATLALVLASSAQANQTFNFTFDDVDFGSGESVSGYVVLNGDGDGTFAASSVFVTSGPAALTSLGYTLPMDMMTGNTVSSNTFSVVGGSIDIGGTSLGIYNHDTSVYFRLNEYPGYYGNSFSVGGYPNTVSVSDWDVTSLRFSAVGAPSAVPEPATWALFAAGAGLMGAGARRRQTAAKTA